MLCRLYPSGRIEGRPGSLLYKFVATSQEKEVYEVKKITEGKEVRELNLIANKGGSGSVGFKLSIPKPWAAALGVDLNNKTVVASFDGDKIIISGIKK